MSNLGPQRINQSFGDLLQLPNGLTPAIQNVQDGSGNITPLEISTTVVDFPITNVSGTTGAITDLPTATGSDYVGFQQNATGALLRSLLEKNQDTLSVSDFCTEGDINSTTGYQLAIDYAIANNKSLDISGNYNVTQISFDNANGLLLTGRGSVVGIATSTTNAVVTMKNVTNIAIDGAWFINGNYNTNYNQGLWIYTDAANQQAAYLDFTNLSIVNCQQAYKIGNDNRPDDLVSEINIRGGNTYGCPNVILAVGAQTVVNFQGSTITSLTGSGNTAWQALPQKTVVSRGATVQITGGELLHVLLSTGGSSADYNTLCEIQPIASVSLGNFWGNITVVGALIESAARFASTKNQSSLSSLVGGSISFVGCHGVSTNITLPCVETDASFQGRLSFKNNNFFASSARSQFTIYCNNTCDVYCDDQSFGRNFVPWIEGTYGGVLHFPYQMVLNTNNLNGQQITNGTAVTLKFNAVVNAGSLARFASSYNAATGVFTVPAGGLKNVRIETQMLLPTLTGEWYVQVNGISYGVRTLGNYNENSYSINQLNAGDTIQVVVVNISPTLFAASTYTDWFQIFASN